MKLTWDKTGERYYETGVDKGVLFPFASDGDSKYAKGVAWNGLSTVTESPSGAEPTSLYANNAKYATLMSAEELSLTLEAYTYPKEFEACDGLADLGDGVTIDQQTRQHFGFVYRTYLGNDEEGNDHGYKLHLVYDCLASPSEKSRATVNDSPDVSPFSWSVTCTPVSVTGYKTTSMLTIDSTKVKQPVLKSIEEKLYGTEDTEPTLPTPDEILNIISSAV